MSEVFAGHHMFSGAPVALKITKFAPNDDFLRRAFTAEIVAMARLQHPGIFRIHDWGIIYTFESERVRVEILKALKPTDSSIFWAGSKPRTHPKTHSRRLRRFSKPTSPTTPMGPQPCAPPTSPTWCAPMKTPSGRVLRKASSSPSAPSRTLNSRRFYSMQPPTLSITGADQAPCRSEHRPARRTATWQTMASPTTAFSADSSAASSAFS